MLLRLYITFKKYTCQYYYIIKQNILIYFVLLFFLSISSSHNLYPNIIAKNKGINVNNNSKLFI